MNALVNALYGRSDTLLAELEAIYKNLRQHPELSIQEVRTAEIATDHIEALGYEAARDVGITGAVGVLRNGDSPTVVLHTNMDTLSMVENTGLPYASTVKAKGEEGTEVDVAHSCGHDIRATWLIGATRVLAEYRDAWRDTVMVAFQPDEEVGRGAASMVDDWDTERLPKPDTVLGQYVMVGASDTVSYRPGVILSAGDSLKIRLFGRGSHSSQPQTSIDPVTMATPTTLRLQTIVSREVSPMDNTVLTIGTLQTGTKEDIIPDEATIKLNMRTFDEDVREYMPASIKRICCTERDASSTERPPEFTTLSAYPLTESDAAATQRLAEAFKAQFGDKAYETKPASASEDFNISGRAWNVPYVSWFIGGTDPQIYAQAEAARQVDKIPSNHSSKFAPVIHPTLETGLHVILTAVSAWLCTSPATR